MGYLGSLYRYWYPSPLVPMYFFLGTHCGGRRCALPPAPLHPLLFFNGISLLPTLFPFFISIIGYLGSYYSYYLYWYPSPLVPMYFFLGTHCGGRRCALPPAPPTRFYFLMGLPCYLHFFFHKHRLLGIILSLLISIATCAYVLLSWYALRGDAFIFKGFPCYLHPFLFS